MEVVNKIIIKYFCNFQCKGLPKSMVTSLRKYKIQLKYYYTKTLCGQKNICHKIKIY